MKTQVTFFAGLMCAVVIGTGANFPAFADQSDKAQIEAILKKIPSQQGTVWQRIKSTSCGMKIDWSSSWVGEMPNGSTQIQIVFGLPVDNPAVQSGLSATWKVMPNGHTSPLNGWAKHLMNEPNDNYGC